MQNCTLLQRTYTPEAQHGSIILKSTSQNSENDEGCDVSRLPKAAVAAEKIRVWKRLNTVLQRILHRRGMIALVTIWQGEPDYMHMQRRYKNCGAIFVIVTMTPLTQELNYETTQVLRVRAEQRSCY